RPDLYPLPLHDALPIFPARRSAVRLHFLGTGTSFGVPVIGCRCAVCTSPDPRDRRTRHAAVVEEDGKRLLIDTPPELRLQLVGRSEEHTSELQSRENLV